MTTWSTPPRRRSRSKRCSSGASGVVEVVVWNSTGTPRATTPSVPITAVRSPAALRSASMR